MSYTVQEAMDRIIREIGGTVPADTVDTLKAGDPTWNVRGIVTTFLATVRVIRRSIALDANLIVTHEPTYYNHVDETDWLETDPVFRAKRRLLAENEIAIWRLHDHWHACNPDGILTGLLRKLGWENSIESDTALPGDCAGHVIALPPAPLADLVKHLKRGLGIPTVRVIGDLSMECRRVVFLPGAAGRTRQIGCLRESDAEVLVCGETAEWETDEYVRDAIALGQRRALVLIGHANSEEAGMDYLAERIREWLPGVPVHPVAAGDPACWA